MLLLSFDRDAPHYALVPALGTQAGAVVPAAGPPGLHTQPGPAPASSAAPDLRARASQGISLLSQIIFSAYTLEKKMLARKVTHEDETREES